MKDKKERVFFWLVLMAFVLLIAANIFNMYFFSGMKNTGRASGSSQASISLIVNGIEETPTPTPTPSPGGGGGGGAAIVDTKPAFSVEPSLFKIMLKRGETFKTEMKIKASKAGSYSLTSDLKQMIIFSDDSFSLKSNEEKIIYVTFISTEDTKFDTYPGKIKISLGSSSQEIPFIVEIKSKKVLFDASLNVPAKYKEIGKGEELLLQVTLFNLGETGKADVLIEYQIKDFEGNVILKKEEMVAVETQASLSRTLQLPSDLKDGQYVAIISVKYRDSFGTSSDVFYVGRKRNELIGKEYLLIALVFVLIAISTSIIIFFNNRKLKHVLQSQQEEVRTASEKIHKGQMKIAEAIKLSERLKLQLALLNKAYEKGYIGKEAFEKGKERIGNLAKEVKKKYL